MEKPTIKERVSIFASNLFQEVECISEICFIDGKPEVFTGIITSVDTEDHCIKVRTRDTFIELFYDQKNIVLLKKQLSKISDEHGSEIAKIITRDDPRNDKTQRSESELISYGKIIIKDMYRITWCAIDFLRYNGYALPHKHYSIEQLIKLGIYKIIE